MPLKRRAPTEALCAMPPQPLLCNTLGLAFL